jgi:hypothetical protein
MARVGGRSLWLAWPIGVICAAVVAALLYLAVPGLPTAVRFTGDLLRGATAAPVAGGEGSAVGGTPEPAATDCRSLYPDRLWSQLVWTPDVLLSQTLAAPAASSPLADALGPAVRFTCTWRVSDARWISSTVAAVVPGSATIAAAALTADGFSCSVDGDAVHCERTRDGATEIHDVRGQTWLSSVLHGWSVDDYAALTASRAF